MPERTIRIIVLALAAVALLALIFGVRSCQQRQTAGAQAKIEKGQANAGIAAGAEAGNTITAVLGNDAATDHTVQGGINEIRNAPPNDRGLAAQRAACRLHNRSTDERCARLLKADPGVPTTAR